MKLGLVVQRYGADINGGAELHARQLAERLARQADVTVLTTCARDYLTWRNELPAGADRVNGVPVERYPVSHERDLTDFAHRSDVVFNRSHTVEDELRWLDSEGPTSTELLAALRERRETFDYVLFFSLRYYHAYHGARAIPDRAVLVPTAERDPALGLSIFGPVLRGARAIMYNSLEERALIQSISGNDDTPSTVVGVGVDVDHAADAARFRAQFGIEEPFIVYVGRIDNNKGCGELFDYFRAYARRSARAPMLVLIGTPVIEIPDDPHIRHVGFVTDDDKFDALAASEALVMPSYYESLSMVALEAWALGKPVLANARCDVLVGQCIRSNGGLYYSDSAEFSAALETLLEHPGIAAALGRNGRAYCERHYAWPVIEEKYRSMFERLDADRARTDRRRSFERLPGWVGRHLNRVPPAADIVNAAPGGPVIEHEELQ